MACHTRVPRGVDELDRLDFDRELQAELAAIVEAAWTAALPDNQRPDPALTEWARGGTTKAHRERGAAAGDPLDPSFRSIWGDGMLPAGRRSPKKPRHGITAFVGIGGGQTWLRTYDRAADRVSWKTILLDRLTRAKCLLLEWESFPIGKSPAERWPRDYHGIPGREQFLIERMARSLSGRAHPLDIIEDVDVLCQCHRVDPMPAWLDERAIRFLLAIVSFDTGGRGQRSEAELFKALRSRDALAKLIRQRGEEFVSEYTDAGTRRQSPIPDERKAHELARFLELADHVQGVQRSEQDRFRARLADLKAKATASSLRVAEAMALIKSMQKSEPGEPTDQQWWDPDSTFARFPSGTPNANASRGGWYVVDPAEVARQKKFLSDSGELRGSGGFTPATNKATAPAGASGWALFFGGEHVSGT